MKLAASIIFRNFQVFASYVMLAMKFITPQKCHRINRTRAMKSPRAVATSSMGGILQKLRNSLTLC